ncbi:post-transcriptional regulator [Evansella sp. AB-rgal1]|uniref:post-transcriptional regulator n=1 Tax=Evansella sp. AB-rgal1 TaxID=3242696 RepID=UPI00359E1D7B
MDEQQWLVWKNKVDIVLTSKAEEWKLFGYNVTKEDVWGCFMSKLPRIDIPETIRYHWLVAELFHMKVNDYMNWLTLQAYRGPNWFDSEEPVTFRLDNFRKEKEETNS